MLEPVCEGKAQPADFPTQFQSCLKSSPGLECCLSLPGNAACPPCWVMILCEWHVFSSCSSHDGSFTALAHSPPEDHLSHRAHGLFHSLFPLSNAFPTASPTCLVLCLGAGPACLMFSLGRVPVPRRGCPLLRFEVVQHAGSGGSSQPTSR